MSWEIENELNSQNSPTLPTKAGLYYSSPNITSLSTLNIAIDKLYSIPIVVTQAMQATTINIDIISQSIGKAARLGIYYDNGGQPGSLFIDGGLISETGTGIKTASISVNLPAGWYWLAILSTGIPNIRANSQTNAFPILGYTSGTDTTTHVGFTVQYSAGTGVVLPNPFPAGGVLASGSMPRLMLGVS